MHWVRTFVLTSLIVSCLGVSYASVVSDQITALESSLTFEETTLYTFVQDTELINGLQNFCPEESLKTGNRFLEKIVVMIDSRYEKMSDAQMLLDSLDLWNRIHAMHQHIPYALNDSSLCVRKMLMYGMQKELRKRHINLIEREGLIDDFNQPNAPLRAVSLKAQILDEFIRSFSRPGLPAIRVTVTNPNFLKTLSAEEKFLAERSRLVMEQAVRYVLFTFQQKGRFTQEDIDQVSPVVELEYTNECGSVAGKYEVSYQQDESGQRSQMHTTHIHLTVSVCHKVGFILQQMWLSRLIVMHELGHHVWWYKDKKPALFTALCWTKDGARNDRCVDRDFVSEYAQTAPEEDYAEHFQQRVIKRRERPGFIDTKLRYFDKLFGI